eukprot:11991749-Alexandrium_andersonii.AAC.1
MRDGKVAVRVAAAGGQVAWAPTSPHATVREFSAVVQRLLGTEGYLQVDGRMADPGSALAAVAMEGELTWRVPG